MDWGAGADPPEDARDGGAGVDPPEQGESSWGGPGRFACLEVEEGSAAEEDGGAPAAAASATSSMEVGDEGANVSRKRGAGDVASASSEQNLGVGPSKREKKKRKAARGAEQAHPEVEQVPSGGEEQTRGTGSAPSGTERPGGDEVHPGEEQLRVAGFAPENELAELPAVESLGGGGF